jgi:hypothetical protein
LFENFREYFCGVFVGTENLKKSAGCKNFSSNAENPLNAKTFQVKPKFRRMQKLFE